MDRFALTYLSNWANRKERKPIIIRGARQVGKSTLVELLSEQENLSMLTLDFERKPETADLFQSNDPTIIISLIGAQTGKPVVPGKTLLFLDEIQATPQILATLRYFYEELPELHVVAAGSLLDFALKEHEFSMPVGRIEYLYLGPMSFEEFLLALNQKKLLEFIQGYQLADTLPESLHLQLLEYLKVYMVLGGLPEVISNYCQHKDFTETERVKHSVIDTYQDDFSKYASKEVTKWVQAIYNKTPRLIGDKFKYSHISRDEKSASIKNALEHLVLAKIVTQVFHTSANGLPLGAEINERNFKTFFLDVGLISTHLGLNITNLTNIEDLTLVNSGKLAEQFVAQHLLYFHELYKKPALYYWNREAKSSSAEIDFIINNKNKIVPIEVKAGKTGQLKSLHYFLKAKQLGLGVRFNAATPSLTSEVASLASSQKVPYQLLSLPLYMVGQLARILENLSD